MSKDADMLAVLQEAEKAIAQVVEGDGGFVAKTTFRGDGIPSKHDRCAHGQSAYDGCVICADMVLYSALERIRASIARAMVQS